MTAPDVVQAILTKVEQAHTAMAARAEAATDHEDFIDLTGRTDGLADTIAIITAFLPGGTPSTLST